MADLTTELQAGVIVNVCVGLHAGSQSVEYEHPDTGIVSKIHLKDMMQNMLKDSFKRMFKPYHFLFPYLLKYSVMPSDYLYTRNVRRLRNFI